MGNVIQERSRAHKQAGAREDGKNAARLSGYAHSLVLAPFDGMMAEVTRICNGNDGVSWPVKARASARSTRHALLALIPRRRRRRTDACVCTNIFDYDEANGKKAGNRMECER